MSSSKEAKNGDTLFDPPPDSSENGKQADSEETVTLQVEVSPELVEKLRELASHLSLHPSTVAARAIELTCEEVQTINADEPITGSVLQQYQARLDLMHTLEEISSFEEDNGSL